MNKFEWVGLVMVCAVIYAAFAGLWRQVFKQQWLKYSEDDIPWIAGALWPVSLFVFLTWVAGGGYNEQKKYERGEK